MNSINSFSSVFVSGWDYSVLDGEIIKPIVVILGERPPNEQTPVQFDQCDDQACQHAHFRAAECEVGLRRSVPQQSTLLSLSVFRNLLEHGHGVMLRARILRFRLLLFRIQHMYLVDVKMLIISRRVLLYVR